jgi:HlyD family secretion protein
MQPSAIRIEQAVETGGNGSSMFLIATDLKKLQIWLSVHESDISKVAIGQPVCFTVDAFPGKRYDGKVAQIRLNAQAVQNQVMFTVVVDIAAPDEQFLPYMTANAEIATANH